MRKVLRGYAKGKDGNLILAPELFARSGGLCGASEAVLNALVDGTATAFCGTVLAGCDGNPDLLLSRACSVPGG
jgi:hypothetical protein